MTERYDESELLDLIEGELDQRAAAALGQRLASDPKARALLEAMARDRAEIRALGEPALPMDFIVQIEPMLARPMLMESVADARAHRPGEFRRLHRRADRRWRALRLAAAAVLLLAALGGAWAMVDGFVLNRLRVAENDRVARHDQQEGAANGHRAQRAPAVIAAADAASFDEVGSGVVHHDRPPLEMAALAAIFRDGDTPADENTAQGAAEMTGAKRVIPVEFALVLTAQDPAAGEAALARLMKDVGERGALVRNFSFAEAQRLAEEYRLAHRGAMGAANSGPAPLRLSGNDLHQLAQRVLEQFHANAARNSAAQTPGVQASGGSETLSRMSNATGDAGVLLLDQTIAGTTDAAPTLEQQLEFSSRGATHTIAVPASEVIALIERLSLTEGQVVMLQMLPSPPALSDIEISSATTTRPTTQSSSSRSLAKAAPAESTTLLWLTEGPRVRQAMSRLSQARDGAMVLLPVIVK